MGKYFAQFNQIVYDGYTALDLTRRVKVLDNVLKNPYTYYPFVLNSDQTPYEISDRYYESMDYVWLIYLANGIVDPVYDWHLSEDQMTNFLVSKYGSIQDATDRIAFYRVNWAETEEVLSVSAYNALDYSLRKYWQPDVPGNKILRYLRSQDDWTVDTNAIKSLTFSGNTVSSGNPAYQNGDLIDFKLGGMVTGSAEVLQTSIEGTLIYKNTSGYTDRYLLLSTGNQNFHVGDTVSLTAANGSLLTNGSIINITTSNLASVQVNLAFDYTTIGHMVSNAATTTVTGITVLSSYISGRNGQANLFYDTTATLVTNIPPVEAAYWAPVSRLDVETEKNAENRTIRILDKSYAVKADTDLRREMKGK